MTQSSYVQPGYFQPGTSYVQDQTTVVFDPTATLPGNAITNEITTPITSAAIFTNQGPFYASTLIVSGVKASDGTTHTLVLGTDYVFSPLFSKQVELIGAEIYSYFLLLNPTQWTSVSANYQAVGCESDSVLLLQIVKLGSFDQMNVSIWSGLVGDSITLGNELKPDVLTNGKTIYMLANMLDKMVKDTKDPNRYLTQSLNDIATLKSEMVAIQNTMNQWNTNIIQTGLLDSFKTATFGPIGPQGIQGPSGLTNSARQTVVSAPANFLTISGLKISINATLTQPVVIAFASGVNGSGPVDYVKAITTNVVTSFNTVAGNVNYLYVDMDGNGNLTFGSTISPPNYSFDYSGGYNVANGVHSYSYGNSTMMVGDGTTVNKVNRVFIGSVSNSGSTLSNLVTYAVQGFFQETVVFPATGNDINFTHNLGVIPLELPKIKASVTGVVFSAGYSLGDFVIPLTQYTTNSVADQIVSWTNSISGGCVLGRINSLVVPGKLVPATLYTPTASNWSATITVRRGW